MLKVISSFYQLFCGFQQAAERSFQKATRRAEIYLKTENNFFSQTRMHILVSFPCSVARDGSFSSPPARHIRSSFSCARFSQFSPFVFCVCVSLFVCFFLYANTRVLWARCSSRTLCSLRISCVFQCCARISHSQSCYSLICFRMIYSMTCSALQYLNK